MDVPARAGRLDVGSSAIGLLIIEVFARLALGAEVLFRQSFKPPIDGVRCRRGTSVGLARGLHNALNVSVAPRFFYIVGKMVIGHLRRDDVFPHQIPNILKVADVTLDIDVSELPAALFDQRMSRSVVLNFTGYFRVTATVEFVAEL